LKIGLETKRLHPLDQDLVVPPVPRAASGDAAFGFELIKRLVKGCHNLNGWRESPLPVGFKGAPLVVKI
jgi:hypothetical protein